MDKTNNSSTINKAILGHQRAGQHMDPSRRCRIRIVVNMDGMAGSKQELANGIRSHHSAMKESLKALLPLEADDIPEAISRVMAACLRKEMSRRRFRSWFTPDLELEELA